MPTKKKPRAATASTKFEPDRLEEYLEAARASSETAGKILDQAIAMASRHGSFAGVLETAFETPETLQAHGQSLREKFPPPTGQAFLSSKDCPNWPPLC